jgi:hypothetical protein
MGSADTDLVWYAAYGSNLHLPRLTCYLEGGCPPGASRTYTGARDTAPPRDVAPVQLPGSLRFGGESPVWGGGVAVLEPAGAGPVAATAYLLTREQVCDVVAQETHQECGTVADLEAAPGGTGWYDDLVRTEHEGRPLYALASESPPATNAPGATYVSMMARGLMASHGWSPQQCAAYLSRIPGMPRSEPGPGR